MKRTSSILFAVVLVLSLVLAAPIVQAATPQEIEASIESGLKWLVTQQQSDGSWPSSHGAPVALTGFALTKLCDRAYETGYNPFNAEYEYMENVELGFNYLFSQASPAGVGIAFDVDTYYENYCTGIAAMAIAASRMPNRLVPTGPYIGQRYKCFLQEVVDYFAWAQVDAPWPDRGGWGYEAGSQSSTNQTSADQSNTGYSVLGLRYAEAAVYGFQCNIPQVVRDEHIFWVDNIQNEDGGSAYMVGHTESNLLRTGNLLFEQSFVGIAFDDPRVQDAIDYIESNWDASTDLQTLYCLMKGFESYGMETITVDSNMVDWYEVFADNIIANQFEDGHFEHLADTWMPELDTVFALLTLEKAAPPPLHQLNHFTCYSVEPTEPIGEKVNLEDQFVAIYNVTVMDAAFFCNPATKFHCNATTPISNFDHHLTVYNIVYYVEPQTFSVKVDNQFGTQDLTIFGPFGLVVPTQKLMPGDHEPPVGLDHFLYYDVIEGPDVNVEVSLSDQFLAEQAGLVTSPVGFATPVQKTHGGDVTEIGNPEAHLVFYEREGGIFEMEVQVVNQFGSNQTLDVSGPVRLAVPSETECYYNLTVSSIGGGSVLIPGEGTFTYDCGTEVDLYAFASDNCWFDKWTGDVGTIANINDPATTIIMNGHYSITANFDCYGSCGGFISISVRDTPIAKEVQTLLGLLVLVSVPSALWVRKRRGSRNGCRST